MQSAGEQQFCKALGIQDEVLLSKLRAYHDLLLKWQNAINIVSPKTLSEVWVRHLLDSAQIVDLVPSEGILADLGCGGGFPGLVLAMMKPHLQVNLVESDERKCQFMRTVSRETKTTNVNIHTQRIERAYDLVTPDVVTARALASLDVLLDYIWPWAQENPALRLVFLKGRGADDEIALARKSYDFDLQIKPSLIEPDSVILLLSSISKKV